MCVHVLSGPLVGLREGFGERCSNRSLGARTGLRGGRRIWTKRLIPDTLDDAERSALSDGYGILSRVPLATCARLSIQVCLGILLLNQLSLRLWVPNEGHMHLGIHIVSVVAPPPPMLCYVPFQLSPVG
jgi:hypothetical protein